MRYPLARVSYGDEEINAVIQTLIKGRTTCGPRVSDFEHAFAEYVGREHAVMVNSGSSADLLVAHSLGPAIDIDEILVPAVTWSTHVQSCLNAGYRVRLVDVDPETMQFDIADIERKMGPNVRAIFVVHVLGNMGQMDELQRIAEQRDTIILEDCCEALGSRWHGKMAGTLGKAAAYSFFFSHLISTMEGGMVVTDSPGVDRKLRLWRSHGWEPIEDEHFHFPTWGWNLRPMEIQGAFGCEQIKKANGFIVSRETNFGMLCEATSKAWPEYLSTPRVIEGVVPAWHGFGLMVSKAAPFTKNALCRYLEEHGIETRPIIAGNIARQPAAMYDQRIDAGPLPGADEIHQRGFYIGLSNVEDRAGIDLVASTMNAFMGGL